MTSKIIHKDRVLGVLLLAITAFFAYHTNKFPDSYVVGDPGPKVFPYIGCSILGLISITLLFKRRTESKEFLNKKEWKRLIKLFSMYVLFFVLLWLFGYLAAIPIATFIISSLFAKEVNIKRSKLLIYTVLATAAIYVAYVVALGSNLPKGIFWKLF